MPHALQVVNAFKQNTTGGAFADSLAPGTGDSFAVQDFVSGRAWLAEVWGTDDDSAMELSIVGTKFHDTQLGLRMNAPAAAGLAPAERASLLSPCGADQQLYPNDLLRLKVTSTAGDNVNVTYIVYYEDLPGIAGRYATWSWVKANTKNLVGVNVGLTAGVGDWGAAATLASADDRLHADTDYALLGFTSNIPVPAIGLSGVDTGNMRVGGPLLGDADHDSTMFIDLAHNYGDVALIPILNANNRYAINLQAAGLTATTPSVDVQLAELSARFIG